MRASTACARRALQLCAGRGAATTMCGCFLVPTPRAGARCHMACHLAACHLARAATRCHMPLQPAAVQAHALPRSPARALPRGHLHVQDVVVAVQHLVTHERVLQHTDALDHLHHLRQQHGGSTAFGRSVCIEAARPGVGTGAGAVRTREQRCSAVRHTAWWPQRACVALTTANSNCSARRSAFGQANPRPSRPPGRTRLEDQAHRARPHRVVVPVLDKACDHAAGAGRGGHHIDRHDAAKRGECVPAGSDGRMRRRELLLRRE